MTRVVRHVGLTLFALELALLSTRARADIDPNPLESAYWRFEEGPNSSNVNFLLADPILDSMNQNHLDTFNADTSPVYTTNVPPTALRSGLPNTLALDFIPHDGGGDDLFTLFGDGALGKGFAKNINNGMIEPGEGFTIEAAFNTNNPARFAAIIAKEGRPGGSRPLPTFALKTRGDNSLLQVEQWDGSGNLVQVSSLAPLNPSQWYYAAVVNDGATLSLYLDSNDGSGYQLQESAAVSGALYQAVPDNPSWDNSWTVGRGQFAGQPADWFDGIIDEVRLTNAALSPAEFLFDSPVPQLIGDYNDDRSVDAADYVVWRKTGINGPQGYTDWRANFGKTAPAAAAAAVPEPATSALFVSALIGIWAGNHRRRLCTTKGSSRGGWKMNYGRAVRQAAACLFAVAIVTATQAVADVAPNPLESAYWRFEEGTNFANVNEAVADPVLDSINQNHLDAFNADTAPVYTNSVPPQALRSGLPNTLALDFIPHVGGGDDLFTLFNDGEFGKGAAKNINNGIIAPGGGFTVEAAFNTNNSARWAAVVGKDGQPGGSRPVQTFVLKTRGDNSHLLAELWDGNGNLTQVNSILPITAGQWYQAAVVNSGSLLSLYLDSNDGSGYQLQSSVAVSGALFQGVPANPLWDASWTVGRGQFGGNPTDWFDGLIDEVRITNAALDPSEFLFASAGSGTVVPEPAALTLVVLSIPLATLRRRKRFELDVRWHTRSRRLS